jgi:hypothetical protein
MRQLLNLEDVNSWPDDLLAYLKKNHKLFLDWEEAHSSRVAPPAHDRAIYGLQDALQPYAITGWHCTRLTRAEIDTIKSTGMQLPSAAMLNQRIYAVLKEGLLTKPVADRLKADNQAAEEYRAGIICFCFFPPRFGGQSGIERFFRHWGGEALYNSHERDPETGIAICRIGRPCLVEADVPIAALDPCSSLCTKVAWRFLIHHGYSTNESVNVEACAIQPLPMETIRRVIVYPDPEFIKLTGCDKWKPRLDPSD